MIIKVTRDNFITSVKNSYLASLYTDEVLGTMYEDLLRVEADSGEQMELDIPFLACTYVECENLEEFRKYYPYSNYDSLPKDLYYVLDIGRTNFNTPWTGRVLVCAL